jgi:FKBP-type peptidyl-prolyl cis-trans isomerase FkpA
MTNTRPDPNDPNWVSQANGLKIWDIQTGSGSPVQTGDSITVFYSGWQVDAPGTLFDSRRSPADPATFALAGLIQGWQQGIPGMLPGGIRRLYVPAALAYPNGGGPSGDLIFEIKLISHT